MIATTEIATSFLRTLEQDSKELAALHAGGVDNWEWYSESLRAAGLLDDDDDDEEDDV